MKEVVYALVLTLLVVAGLYVVAPELVLVVFRFIRDAANALYEAVVRGGRGLEGGY